MKPSIALNTHREAIRRIVAERVLAGDAFTELDYTA